MLSRAEIYQQKAAECRSKAEGAGTRARKATFLELAGKWAAMAEEVAMQERQPKESITSE